MCTAESLLEFQSSGSDTLLQTYLIKISKTELDSCIYKFGDSDIHEAVQDPFPTFLPHLLPLSTLYFSPPARVGHRSSPKSTKLLYLYCSGFAKEPEAFWNAVHFLIPLAHSFLCIFEVFFTITTFLTNLTPLQCCFLTICLLSFPHPRSLFRYLFLTGHSARFATTDRLNICLCTVTLSRAKHPVTSKFFVFSHSL